MSWIPDGSRLRHLREQQEYTIELLADAAGVGEKTIRNLESGRTRKARLTTLKALAAVLDIDVTEIAAAAGVPGKGPASSRSPDPAASPQKNPPAQDAHEAGRQKERAGGPFGPSRLEMLVEQELAQKRPPPLHIAGRAGGPVLMLTPKKFQDIITAFVLHEGARLWLPGSVLRQRGISEVEAGRLGTECGVGARFLISERTELTGGESFHVTVYTATSAHTRVLQERLESRAEVALLLRVVVSRPELPPLPFTDAGHGLTRPRFQGFSMYGSQTFHPWTFLVEDILEQKGATS